MAKENSVVHVQKLLFKKYMIIYKINFFNKIEKKKIIEEKLIPLLDLKKKKKHIYIYIYISYLYSVLKYIYYGLHCVYSFYN